MQAGKQEWGTEASAEARRRAWKPRGRANSQSSPGAPRSFQGPPKDVPDRAKSCTARRCESVFGRSLGPGFRAGPRRPRRSGPGQSTLAGDQIEARTPRQRRHRQSTRGKAENKAREAEGRAAGGLTGSAAAGAAAAAGASTTGSAAFAADADFGVDGLDADLAGDLDILLGGEEEGWLEKKVS